MSHVNFEYRLDQEVLAKKDQDFMGVKTYMIIKNENQDNDIQYNQPTKLFKHPFKQ